MIHTASPIVRIKIVLSCLILKSVELGTNVWTKLTKKVITVACDFESAVWINIDSPSPINRSQFAFFDKMSQCKMEG